MLRLCIHTHSSDTMSLYLRLSVINADKTIDGNVESNNNRRRRRRRLRKKKDDEDGDDDRAHDDNGNNQRCFSSRFNLSLAT